MECAHSYNDLQPPRLCHRKKTDYPSTTVPSREAKRLIMNKEGKMPHAFRQLHWSRHIEIENYYMPDTLHAALALLEEHKGGARVIAGGTDDSGVEKKRY